MPTAGVKVILSVAVSLDGFIDDCGAERLRLSDAADKAAVAELRSRCDAILVGAEAVRRDNPKLVIEDEAAKSERKQRGLKPDLVKVTLTQSGNLPVHSRFFTAGEGDKLVYCPESKAVSLRAALGSVAQVIGLPGQSAGLSALLADLAARQVRTLLVEGGTKILTLFLASGMVDELRVAVAPFFVGDSRAPRFVGDGNFPFFKDRRLELVAAAKVGDMAVLSYRPYVQS